MANNTREHSYIMWRQSQGWKNHVYAGRGNEHDDQRAVMVWRWSRTARSVRDERRFIPIESINNII